MQPLFLLLFLLFLTGNAKAQCTSCSNCSATFCDITISSNNSAAYTLSGNFSEDKLCITGGTYSGAITINGSTPSICITGGTFAPSSFTNPGGYSFTLYVNNGGSATFPGNTTLTNNWYNNGTMTINGNLNTTGGFPDNCGSLTVNGDFTNTTSLDNCSGGSILVTGDLKNDGTFNINGDVTVRDSFINTGQITGYNGVTITTKHWLNGTGSNGGQIMGPGAGTFCFNISDYAKNSSDGQVTGNVGICDLTPTGGCSSPECMDDNDGTLGAGVTNCAGACNGSTLPVELLHFAASHQDHKVRLEWITASEINNDYFLVERSANGVLFETIGRVTGHGTTPRKHLYEFSDETPVPGNMYYRLRQVDYDGQFSYSSLVAVLYRPDRIDVLNISSPEHGDRISYLVHLPEEKIIEIQVADLLGNVITRIKETAPAGISRKYIHFSGLRDGCYLLIIKSGEECIVKRFIK